MGYWILFGLFVSSAVNAAVYAPEVVYKETYHEYASPEHVPVPFEKYGPPPEDKPKPNFNQVVQTEFTYNIEEKPHTPRPEIAPKVSYVTPFPTVTVSTPVFVAPPSPSPAEVIIEEIPKVVPIIESSYTYNVPESKQEKQYPNEKSPQTEQNGGESPNKGDNFEQPYVQSKYGVPTAVTISPVQSYVTVAPPKVVIEGQGKGVPVVQTSYIYNIQESTGGKYPNNEQFPIKTPNGESFFVENDNTVFVEHPTGIPIGKLHPYQDVPEIVPVVEPHLTPVVETSYIYSVPEYSPEKPEEGKGPGKYFPVANTVNEVPQDQGQGRFPGYVKPGKSEYSFPSGNTVDEQPESVPKAPFDTPEFYPYPGHKENAEKPKTTPEVIPVPVSFHGNHEYTVIAVPGEVPSHPAHISDIPFSVPVDYYGHPIPTAVAPPPTTNVITSYSYSFPQAEELKPDYHIPENKYEYPPGSVVVQKFPSPYPNGQVPVSYYYSYDGQASAPSKPFCFPGFGGLYPTYGLYPFPPFTRPEGGQVIVEKPDSQDYPSQAISPPPVVTVIEEQQGPVIGDTPVIEEAFPEERPETPSVTVVVEKTAPPKDQETTYPYSPAVPEAEEKTYPYPPATSQVEEKTYPYPPFGTAS